MDLATYYRQAPIGKPEARKRTKGRKDRAEAKVEKVTRAKCVDRDGYCRIGSRGTEEVLDVYDPLLFVPSLADGCEGPSQWAHRGELRRARTRGQAPEIRHTTAGSLMLCQRHHDQYDNTQKPRLFITALTAKGADGPLKFRRGK